MNSIFERLLSYSGGVAGAAFLVMGSSATLEAQTANPPADTDETLGFELENLDTSVRPQDDFYRFVNGGWLDRTEIPSDESSYGAFTELRDESDAALREIVEELVVDGDHTTGSDEQKVADYYRSFMDVERIEALGLEPLRPELYHLSRLRDHDQLPILFANLQRIGVQTPVGMFVGQDQREATEYIASLSQSGLGLPNRNFYFEDDERSEELREAYVSYVATVLRLAGEPGANEAAREIMALETALAEHHWTPERNRDREATYNRYEIDELSSLASSFDWGRYLQALRADVEPDLIVRQPDYLEALDDILRDTPVETWRQYLTFKLVNGYASSLSSDFVDAQFEFSGRELQGIEEQRSRERRGVSTVEGALGEAVGRMYVERHFPPESRERMEELVDNLMVAFERGIDDLEWMTDETKEEAQAKLASFNTKIGYPDEWRDYSALEVRADDLVGNAMRSRRFGHNRMITRLGGPVDRTEWGMTPQTVNAYYSSTMNEIVFPAAILQPPFFNPEADDAVNYGAIGGVIGHEISHGFDDQGSRSDGDGNLRNWWTDEDQAAFTERTDRLVEQYSAYCPLEGVCVSGELALGENIADLSGLTVAHDAYRISLEGEEAPVLEGFTGDQRFFMGWAQVWRMNYREQALRQRVRVGPHSPNMYRTNGVVTNMPAFYEAFEVDESDELYQPPEERIQIW